MRWVGWIGGGAFLLLPLWGQRVYPLHADLVVNGGFEDMKELVQRCEVEVPTHTGQRVRLFYPAFTPRYSSLGIVHPMWEYRRIPAARGSALADRYRDMPYRRLRGGDKSLPYLPLRYNYPSCHVIRPPGGAPVWVAIEDPGAWGEPDTLWVTSSVHGVEPGWGRVDTLAVEELEGSFLVPLRHWSGRGLQWGTTRRHLQGLLHFAPYWVSTVGHPQFFFYPEMPFPPLSTLSWGAADLGRFAPEASHHLLTLGDTGVIANTLVCCGIYSPLFGRIQKHGLDWLDGWYYMASSLGRIGQLGVRQMYPQPRWVWDTVEAARVGEIVFFSWRGRHSFPYNYLHRNRYNGVYTAVEEAVRGGSSLFGQVSSYSPFISEAGSSPEGESMGLQPFQDEARYWGGGFSIIAAFYRTLWYPSEEVLGSFSHNNLLETFPRQFDLPWAGNYVLWMDSVWGPLWRRGEPWAWMDRRGVYRCGSPWYVERVGAYGLLWEMGNSLWFHPLRSVGGQFQNRPLWHHRRLGRNISVVKVRPAWHRLGVEGVQIGGPCGEIGPYRGEGYITISYPVRGFHGFRDSEGYRAWLRGLDRRFGVRENLAREFWFYAPGRWVGYDSIGRVYLGVTRYADSVWKAAWDSAVSWAGVRCGAPVFYSDPFWQAVWEANRSWVEEMYRDFRWPEVRRDSLRWVSLGRCCGGLWNGRGEEGGPAAFPYDSGWGLRTAWVWGPMQMVGPTGSGCPDTARLVGYGLDLECAQQTYCVGRCPEPAIGPSGGDTAAVENQAVNVAGYYRWVGRKRIEHRYAGGYQGAPPFPQFSPRYKYLPVYEDWGGGVYRRVPPQYREWSFAGMSWFPYFQNMNRVYSAPDTGRVEWWQKLPVGSTYQWSQSSTAMDVWWRGYRIGERGCYMSLNHGPKESCCEGWERKVNRAYAVMGYLKEPLEAGKRYRLRLAVAVPRRSVYVIHNVGVVVSTEPIPNVYPYCRVDLVGKVGISWEDPWWLSKARWSWWENETVRLDTAIGRWVVLEGTLVATGGERFIYVGWLDSTRLDTQYVGFEEERFWRNGVSTCGAGLVADSVWERWYGDSGVNRAAGYLEWWVQGGDGGLHLDEVSLWDDEVGGIGEGEVQVWDGFCGGYGLGRIRMRGGTPPYDCIWYREGRRVREGCDQEGLEAGWYHIVVVDSTGREWRGWVEVKRYDTVGVVVDKVWDIEDGPGGAIVRGVSGAPPYQVRWEPVGIVGDTLFTWVEGRYVAIVRDSVGCERRVEVEIGGRNAVWVPSAFSPNGDGINEEVWPVVRYPARVRELRWAVYDRWGTQVYEGRGVESRWDGRKGGIPVPEGVYVVYVWVWFEGRSEPVEYKGTVTVVR